MGMLLERDVKRLFSILGFKTITNVRIKGYEVDVLATSKDYKIIIECKQREKSESLDIRNLIHQWESKNNIIKADKVIIVIYGLKVGYSYKSLGKKLGISIWDTNDFEKYFDFALKNREKAINFLFKDVKIKTKGKVEEEEVSEYQERRGRKLETIIERLYERGTFGETRIDIIAEGNHLNLLLMPDGFSLKLIIGYTLVYALGEEPFWIDRVFYETGDGYPLIVFPFIEGEYGKHATARNYYKDKETMEREEEAKKKIVELGKKNGFKIEDIIKPVKIKKESEHISLNIELKERKIGYKIFIEKGRLFEFVEMVFKKVYRLDDIYDFIIKKI